MSTTSTFAFMIGACPFCGAPPQSKGMVKQTDILYRCPVCDFPIETFCIMGFLQEFEQQIDQQLQDIDLMISKREDLRQ